MSPVSYLHLNDFLRGVVSAFWLLSSIISTSFCKQNPLAFHMWGWGSYRAAFCGGDALAWQVGGASLVSQPCVRVGEEEEEQEGVSRGQGQGKQPCFPVLVLLLAWLRTRCGCNESLGKSAKVQRPTVSHLVWHTEGVRAEKKEIGMGTIQCLF